MRERERVPERLCLDNKVVIVTGAAMGIGRGIASGMAREGAHVVIADVNREASEQTEEGIKQFGKRVLVVPTDVRDYEQNQQLVDATLKEFGRIDILVNNAGVNTEGGLLTITREGAMDVFTTNLIGPFFLTQRVAQEMVNRKTKGSILFTSSVHGKITMVHPAYAASKAGLEMFIEDTALELAKYGIRVNAVAPGAIAIRGEEERTNPHVPIGYTGTPGDIAEAMIFLASDAASYVTGQTLTVDGGFSLAHTHYWIQKGKL